MWGSTLQTTQWGSRSRTRGRRTANLFSTIALIFDDGRPVEYDGYQGRDPAKPGALVAAMQVDAIRHMTMSSGRPYSITALPVAAGTPTLATYTAVLVLHGCSVPTDGDRLHLIADLIDGCRSPSQGSQVYALHPDIEAVGGPDSAILHEYDHAFAPSVPPAYLATMGLKNATETGSDPLFALDLSFLDARRLARQPTIGNALTIGALVSSASSALAWPTAAHRIAFVSLSQYDDAVLESIQGEVDRADASTLPPGGISWHPYASNSGNWRACASLLVDTLDAALCFDAQSVLACLACGLPFALHSEALTRGGGLASLLEQSLGADVVSQIAFSLDGDPWMDDALERALALPAQTWVEARTALRTLALTRIRMSLLNMLGSKKRRVLYASPRDLLSGRVDRDLDSLHETNIWSLSILLDQANLSKVRAWYYGEIDGAWRPLLSSGRASEVARLLLYNVSRRLCHPMAELSALVQALLRGDVPPAVLASEALQHELSSVAVRNPMELPGIPLVLPKALLDAYRLVVDSHSFDLFQGLHRSGWNYALQGLYGLDARIRPSEGAYDELPELLLDTYVDRTFHWGRSVLAARGIVPFRTPWAGVVHHTFDTGNGPHNCEQLFACQDFLESLPACKVLIALSEDLASKLRGALASAGFGDSVPVVSAVHPTELDAPAFSMDKFAQNPSRQIVQVGAWLRDTFAVYDLHLAPAAPSSRGAIGGTSANPWGVRPAVLIGPEMQGHFMPANFMEAIQAAVGSLDSGAVQDPGTMSRGAPANKFLAGFVRSLASQVDGVTVHAELSDAAFDDLLSRNVVFLQLDDCSAVNTVVECIARATPVFVNRLPALEELLGRDYPGFYAHRNEVPIMLSDRTRVQRMHDWLRALDRSRLSLQAFVRSIAASLGAAVVSPAPV